MTENRRNELGPDEEALQWLEALPNASHETRKAFAVWIRRSPEHLEAYLRQQALRTELQGLRLDLQPDLGSLLARAKGASKVVNWPGGIHSETPRLRTESPPIPRRRTRWRWLAAAASLAILFAAPWCYQ